MTRLAQAILKRQQTIESSMAAPFSMRPVIEPKISERTRQRFLDSNPFYRMEEKNVLNDLQLTRLLSEVNINIPTGVSPSSAEGQEYIQNQLSIISEELGQPVKTVTDLIQLYESPTDTMTKKLEQTQAENKQDMVAYLEEIRDQGNGIDLTLAAVTSSLDQMLKAETNDKAGFEESKEEIPVAVEMATPIPFVIVQSGEGRTTNKEIATQLINKGVELPKKYNKKDLIELAKENGATITVGKKKAKNNKGKNQKGTDRK